MGTIILCPPLMCERNESSDDDHVVTDMIDLEIESIYGDKKKGEASFQNIVNPMIILIVIAHPLPTYLGTYPPRYIQI